MTEVKQKALFRGSSQIGEFFFIQSFHIVPDWGWGVGNHTFSVGGKCVIIYGGTPLHCSLKLRRCAATRAVAVGAPVKQVCSRVNAPCRAFFLLRGCGRVSMHLFLFSFC